MTLNPVRLSLAAACLLAFLGLAIGQTSSSGSNGKVEKPMRDVRYVVLHSPGPKWLPGKTLFEQPGVLEHVEYLDDKGGGMMIPTAGVSEDEVAKYAADDPAVKSGVLLAEVRPWVIGMSQ
jgi:hypothetical protein